ncbi:hypothetical protein H310_10367 [Aphanomyces invadans]|uniref:Tr-type G domain-containing protein n=1 Tax=Aphanomyces invadans TaxID=157072 RepID=A0A024TRB1_9STRA|nr:hypothetical protein H310_10367 [Aphanomyces invadans]ETV96166.1 hypothetical protein H310_10367 [Aphanomyces invadans]|eukprot:XP_008874958.1 hypothetical protein H310_10367 [Aphanomyces invadans]
MLPGAHPTCPSNMAAQLRLPVHLRRVLSRNFASKPEAQAWTTRKNATGSDNAKPAAAALPSGRKTWDKVLKAWVPYVEKAATTSSPPPTFSQGKTINGTGTTRQSWLKPSAAKVDDTPRFKLFGKGGEIQVDSTAVSSSEGRPRPPQKQQQPQQKKSFKFEKSLFSKDYFPDVSWNSSASAADQSKKSPRQNYQQRNNITHHHKRHHGRKRSNVAKVPQREMKVEIPTVITVEDLAERMCIKAHLLLRTLRSMGEKNLTESSELSATVAELAVEDMGMTPIMVQGFVDLKPTPVPDNCDGLPARPPIVTVMGHVDHGKTTLLDALRKTTTKEHGGITQKIGSFTVPIEDKSIVFFDTPGHAAFATMRAQGCSLTDILVVVIAADDGIQPQTKEVLRLAVENAVPLIVAVTKCDRYPGQEAEIVKRVTKEVQMEGIGEEDMQLVCVSGKTGDGIDELKQAILLQADIMELRADPSKPGEGVVVEGSVVRGWGVTVDAMVTWGTLRVGQLVVCGLEYGKIKSLVDEHGKHLQAAGPGTPVRVVGLKDLPKTGQTILPVETEDEAKVVVSERARILEQIAMKEAEAEAARLREGEAAHVSLGRRGKARQLELQRQERAKEEERLESLTPDDEGYVPKVIPVVLKANALGIIDAIDHMITELNTLSRECVLKCIFSGVGPVSTSDIDLAARTNATIFTFNTRQPSLIEKDALRKQVAIKSHNIIYSLMDDIETLMTSQMTHLDQEESIGAAEILEFIPINLKGRRKASIAGVRVTDGSLVMDAKYRIVRDGEVLSEDLSLESMRHFQDKISESPKGQECGVQFTDGEVTFKAGDILQAYRSIKVRPKLLR